MTTSTHPSITNTMLKLVDMNITIDVTSVTGSGCVLVAPGSQLFKANLKHEIRVDVTDIPPHFEFAVAIWAQIWDILEEGLEECEATAFCSKCESKSDNISEDEGLCGYCFDDKEEAAE